MLAYIGQIAKALYAALVAALSGLVTVLVGDTGFGDLSAGQWVTIVLAALVAGGGTYGIPNRGA